MKIRDIMTRKVVVVNLDTRVVDIANLLATKGIHGVPVVNKSGIVAGIITISDFFIKGYPEIYLPSYIDFLKKTKFHNNVESKQRHILAKLIKAKDEDIMSKNCVTINDEMDVNDLLERYRTSSLKTIPIIDSAGKIAGIVTRSDIIKLIKI